MASCIVIGLGGVGSYFTEALKEMIDKEQLPLTDEYTLVDFDTVEPKNRIYQNFTEEDFGKNKAEVLAQRYSFKFKNEKITTEEQLKPYDQLIICADNAIVRELAFRHCSKAKKPFIDLRCFGRTSSYLVHNKQKLKELINTLPPERDEGGSCQAEQKLAKKQIDLSNRIIAWKGVQLLLNQHRKIRLIDDYGTETI